MPKSERSAGFVVYHRAAEGLPEQWLLLDSGSHWDFPKGHVDEGEDDLAAALRELREESGIASPQIIPHFQHEISYFFREKRGLIRKTVMFYLAESATPGVTLSHEHVGFTWLPYEAAVKQVTYPAARQVLRAAHARLHAPG